MNAVEIEQAVYELSEDKFSQVEFPFRFLICFGNKETTIDRLRSGNNNKSDIQNGVLQRNNIHIATCETGKVNLTIDKLKASNETIKAKAKFILATDGDELCAEDLNSGEMISCEYNKFANHFGFFLPLAGITTIKQIRDNPIDIQATSRLNRLYVELLRANEDWANTERRKDMNQFMGRLIFCFFAEDTNIFKGDNLFTKTIEQMSDSKSNNTDYVLKELFRSMDTPFDNRSSSDIPRWADVMPYVNGGLFAGTRDVPKFTRAARSYLLHAGGLNWKEINPDIFGSMIQAVADDEERGGLGMHYTSVPNILKVLNPLFLDELRESFDEASDNGRKLLNLKKRLTRIRVFDPACGSGNFLVIAYKELREIEFKINQIRRETHLKSEIPLNNFRGIELRVFPAEIARLALIIAEFQCDVFYRGQKDALNDFLPLDSQNWIVCANALRLDWLSICPPTGITVRHNAEDLFHTPLEQNEIEFENEGGETFICGNPPYKGSRDQTNEQKADMQHVADTTTINVRSLDYVCGWFIKAMKYSVKNDKTEIAFVATKSICQGDQVPELWPYILQNEYRIRFAYRSFKWSNLATHNAGVVVIILGLSKEKKSLAKFYDQENDNSIKVNLIKNINPYLISSKNVIINASQRPISNLPKMIRGNMPYDGGNLLLSSSELADLNLDKFQKSKFIRRIFGSAEFIKGNTRYCLWIKDSDLNDALSIPKIFSRIEKVKQMRLSSRDKAANQLAEKSHQMREFREAKNYSIVLPRISGENRNYLPVGILPGSSISTSQNFLIFDADIYLIAILASKLHLAWISTVCTRLGQSYSYTANVGWNSFPCPLLTEKNKIDLTTSAQNILLVREKHFPKTISELYKPCNMPEDLYQAHEFNDEVLERIYIGRKFKNTTERLEKLFDLYMRTTSTPIRNERVL